MIYKFLRRNTKTILRFII